MATQLMSQCHFMLMAFLVLLFCQAALHKTTSLRRFSGYVADYHPRLEAFSFPLAVGLLAAECAAIVLSVIPSTSTAGQCLLALLLAVYTLALATALISGKTQIVCGCGETPVQVSARAIVRNLCLLSLAAVMLGMPDDHISNLALGVALTAGFMLWVAYLLTEQLQHNSDLKQRLTNPNPDQESL